MYFIFSVQKTSYEGKNLILFVTINCMILIPFTVSGNYPMQMTTQELRGITLNDHPDCKYCHMPGKGQKPKGQNMIMKIMSTVRAPVFGTLNSAISNFQTWFVRTVMEVIEYCWM